MKKGKSRGVGLVEVLLGSALLAAGMVGLITFTTKSIKTKHVVEAKEDVQGITEVMKTSLSALPSTPAEYKQVLGSKWVKITDPWGNHYRMIVAGNLSSDLCNLGATSLSVELPDGKVVKNVLYLTWTRTERMVETGQVPSSGNASLSEFGTTYARYSGNVRLTRDAIYDVYTLDMYKAENCSVAGGGSGNNGRGTGSGNVGGGYGWIDTAGGGGSSQQAVLYTDCGGSSCTLYQGTTVWDPFTGQARTEYIPVGELHNNGQPIRIGDAVVELYIPVGGSTVLLVPMPGAAQGVSGEMFFTEFGFVAAIENIIGDYNYFYNYYGYGYGYGYGYDGYGYSYDYGYDYGYDWWDR